MPESILFTPPRRWGLIVHTLVILLLVLGGSAALIAALRAEIGQAFLVYLLIAVLVVAPIPLLVYRAFALLRAYYVVERDGIRLQWGLRAEDIPMPEVQSVHPVSDLDRPLRLPWLRWPGAILGRSQVPGLGTVEFLAADRRNLILIVTYAGAYAISPEDPSAFLRSFQDQTELGSLSPLAPRTQLPGHLIGRVWTDLTARYVLLLGSLMSVGALVWVALIIPSVSRLPLGFAPGGEPRSPVPAVQLSLLPVIHAIFFTADVSLGLFFYRRQESRPLAYLLWVTGAVTSLLFLGAMFWIVQAG